MKQKKIGDILYVYSTTAYEITEDTDATVIKIQEECIPAYAALNASLVSKFSPINYKLFCVVKPEWADYMNDYTVTVKSVLGGTATATPNGGDEGEEITLTITPNTGFELVELQVKDDDLNDIEVTDNKFLMPASNVTVNALFDKSYFMITVDDQIQNGSLETSKWQAQLGDTVTITATPASGYELDTLTVMCGSLEISVVNNQFTMPAGDVTVTGTFVVQSFEITCEPTSHGTVSAPATATAGTAVTITVTPDAGYVLDNLSVVDSGSSPVVVTNNTFTMPSSDVHIYASFLEVHYEEQYFTIESLEDGNTLTLSSKVGGSYSTDDGTTWNTNSSGTTINLDTGDKVMFKNTGNDFAQAGDGSLSDPIFGTTKTVNAYGNIMSLLYGDNFVNQTSLPLPSTSNVYGNFIGLFYGCNVVDASNLILPATTLQQKCYEKMFFECTSLTTAPELPATTLVSNCYNGMFQGCTSLTTAPILPATTSATECYVSMFQGCSSLDEVTMLLEDIHTSSGSSAPAFLYDWLTGCSSTGTIYVSPRLTSEQKTTVSFSLPGGGETLWTIEDYTS